MLRSLKIGGDARDSRESERLSHIAPFHPTPFTPQTQVRIFLLHYPPPSLRTPPTGVSTVPPSPRPDAERTLISRVVRPHLLCHARLIGISLWAGLLLPFLPPSSLPSTPSYLLLHPPPRASPLPHLTV